MLGDEWLRKNVEKRQLSFADDDRIALVERFLLRRRAVNKNVVHAPFQRAVLVIAIYDPEPLAVGHNVRVLARYAAVVQNDAVLIRPPDGVILSRFERKLALGTARFDDP